MGLFDFLGGGDDDNKVKFLTVPQTPGAKKSRAELERLAFGEPPGVPRREIAPLPPVTEERELARTTAKELIQPQDIFALPEVQGIIQEARQTGNLLANRLSRMLQASGALTSTPGRDVLGRAVTDVQKSLAASLAPFASEERARRRGLIPTLESLGLTQEERERGISQAEFDALFQQQFTESQQLETFTIPLLKSIIGLQPGVVPTIPTEGASAISQLAPLIGPILGGVLSGGQTAGQTGGAGQTDGGGSFLGKSSPTGSSQSDVQLAIQLATLLSDERLKENSKPIKNALDKIGKLVGKTFNFKTKNERNAGIMAQDLEKVLPEAVVEHQGVKFIRLDGVLALVINAINELAGKVS